MLEDWDNDMNWDNAMPVAKTDSFFCDMTPITLAYKPDDVETPDDVTIYFRLVLVSDMEATVDTNALQIAYSIPTE